MQIDANDKEKKNEEIVKTQKKGLREELIGVAEKIRNYHPIQRDYFQQEEIYRSYILSLQKVG